MTNPTSKRRSLANGATPYLKKDKDFNGLILYHSLEGKFVNGWRYTVGKVTHKVKLDFDTDIRLKLKSGHYECTTYNIYEMFVECTYLGITGEYGLLYCSDDITYEYIGSVEECVYVDDGDDVISGGGYDSSQQEIKETLCSAYNGMVNIESLNNNSNFSPIQEQFIISLANLAAMSELGPPAWIETLQSNLRNYDTNSNLYSKYNKLNNHELYTGGWESVYNSSPNSDNALLSPEIGDSNFRLKYYPEKNGEYKALGLVKEGDLAHTVEGALEYLEGYLRDNHGFNDDFLYDMHFYNALNFMGDYCDD